MKPFVVTFGWALVFCLAGLASLPRAAGAQTTYKIIDGWFAKGNTWDYDVRWSMVDNTTVTATNVQNSTVVDGDTIFGTKTLKMQNISYLDVDWYSWEWLSLGSSSLKAFVRTNNPKAGSTKGYAEEFLEGKSLEVLPVSVSDTDSQKIIGDGLCLYSTDGSQWDPKYYTTDVTYVGQETMTLSAGKFDCVKMYVREIWKASDSAGKIADYGHTYRNLWMNGKVGMIKEERTEFTFKAAEQKSYTAMGTKSLLRTNVVADLEPTSPEDWPAPIVVSRGTGTHKQESVYVGKPARIDMAFLNDSYKDVTSDIYAYLYDDGSYVGSCQAGGLQAHHEFTKQDWQHTFTKVGTHKLKLVVDTKNAVWESNEENNSYEMSLTVLDLPDLAVDSCSWSPASPHEGNTVKVSFKAKNSGGVEASACKYTVLLDGVEKFRGSVPKIAAGASSSVSSISIGQPKAGQHQVKVNLDVDQIIIEKSDSNNAMTKSMTVLGPTAAQQWQDYR